MAQLGFVALTIAAAFASSIPAWAQEALDVPAAGQGNDPINAVVKLEVTTAKSDALCPWANRTDCCVGSGVVIDNGRILTCAHCVADSTYIRVRKQNEDALYHAAVLFTDNDADLALVGVDDPKFMEDITPMEIGNTPHVQDDVLAVGYPIGGEDISFTRGIISRIEDIRYAHGWTVLLGVQVDAAINRGNSGGPAYEAQPDPSGQKRRPSEVTTSDQHSPKLRLGKLATNLVRLSRW